jgi:hypothetical protein
MSADSPQPSEITLHGLVSLENHRPAPGKPNTFIFDTVFPCIAQTADGVANCQHYIGQDRSKKLDNVYDIRAKVCFNVSPLFHAPSCSCTDRKFQTRM